MSVIESLCEKESFLDLPRREELSQSAIISMYSLPNVTPPAAPEADRTRSSWMSREGGARAAFLDARESAPDSPSTLICTLREHGLLPALKQCLEIMEGKDAGEDWPKVTAVLSKALSIVVSGFHLSTSIFTKLYPHHSLSPEQIVRQFSECGSAWSETKIRALDWHPHTLKLAVASIDDAVRVFYGSSSEKTLVPTLKHPRQKIVSSVKWRPLSASGLAVAAQDGVILWTVDPNSLSSRPSSSCVTFLTLSGHRPVTSLAWANDGQMLFSASPSDNRVVTWDVARDGQPTPLMAITGGGVSLLSFSPNGKLLLTATPSPEFRVWNTANWSNEKWTCLNGRLRTAAWSPDGAILLFATEADSVIYAIDFKTDWEISNKKGGNGIETAGQSARAVLDLSELSLNESALEPSFVSGGSVHQLAWDSSGERLAVACQSQDGHPGLVALFVSRLRTGAGGGGASSVEFFPAGVIRSIDSEPFAVAIAFCPKFPPGSEPPWSPGALLAVDWAVSGRISYHPLHFIPSIQSGGSASVLNSSLANTKLPSMPSQNNTLPTNVFLNNTLPNNIFLNNTMPNSSFHSLNLSKSSQTQLFSLAD